MIRRTMIPLLAILRMIGGRNTNTAGECDGMQQQESAQTYACKRQVKEG